MAQELRQEYLAFANSIRSKATLKVYNYDIKNYMRHLKVSDISTLLKGDNKTIEQQIISYLVTMRQAPNSVGFALRHRRLAGIKKFMEMNDVILNWKKINQYLGARQRVGKDRGYTTEGIQRLLLTCTDERMRAVILLLASTGME